MPPGSRLWRHEEGSAERRNPERVIHAARDSVVCGGTSSGACTAHGHGHGADESRDRGVEHAARDRPPVASGRAPAHSSLLVNLVYADHARSCVPAGLLGGRARRSGTIRAAPSHADKLPREYSARQGVCRHGRRRALARRRTEMGYGMTLVATPEPTITPGPAARFGMVARQLARRPLAVFGLAVIVVIVAAAIAAPLLAPFPPDEQLFDGLTHRGRAAAAERAPSCSAPICSAAISSPACSTARAPRSSSAWSPTASRSRSARWSGSPPASSAASSAAC